jgi:arabinofuranan 3-O-arabinosyltransferase
VTGATKPFWLVLGETQNRGWAASVDGGPSLGGSTLLDGFANGWKVDPGSLGAAGKSGTFEVTLDWLPQERVWAALVVSGAAAALCVLLAVWPRRRKRLTVWQAFMDRRAGALDALVVAPQSRLGPDPDGPVLVSPFAFKRTARAPVWVAMLTAVAAGLIAAALSTPWSPWAGLIVGPACGLLALSRHTRFLVTLSSVALLVATGLYVTLGQAQHHYLVGANWPAQFKLAGVLTSVAVLLLGADALAERVRSRYPEPAPPGQPAEAGAD